MDVCLLDFTEEVGLPDIDPIEAEVAQLEKIKLAEIVRRRMMKGEAMCFSYC